jgi:uncharacterized damage-inducible protein DinB
MALNPYAGHLGGRNALEVVAATPGSLAKLTELLGDEGLRRNRGAGTWSASEILCHLADTELAFAFRLRQALAEDNHVIQPFDQDAWARHYRRLDAKLALAMFAAVRRWNLALLEAVPAEAFTRKVTHPERGEMEYHVLVETMGGHDLNHIAQLESIAASRPLEATQRQ